MLEVLLVIAAALFLGLIVFVHVRRFPPKAQLVCDLWEMVEAGVEKRRANRAANSSHRAPQNR